MEQKLYYNYKQFEKDMQIVAKKIKDNQVKYKNIFTVPRGGLIMAVRLSHLLNLPLILKKKYITQKTIIVDEIIDTGKTLHKYKNYFTVCLHYKPWANFKPSIFCHQTKKWVIYFWESKKIIK
ncbi:MAG: hypothetical protein ABIA74_05295 [bacterium]